MAVSKQQVFLQAWEELLSSKKGNNVSLSLQRYQEVIEELKVAKSKKGGTSDAEYRLLQRFEMVTIGDSEFLIRKNKKNNKKGDMLYYVANEHLFEKIQTIHLNHGHGGINKMMQHVNEKYYNITTEAVKLFISHCDECEVRCNRVASKTVVTNPIRSHDLNSRCQVDLIDMQSQPDGDYTWILNYQDHFTKFVQLRPLKSKRAEEVAATLVDIFLTTNGAPRILQSDRGGEFVNSWIEEIARQWPGMKLVKGRSRYPQSQGSVESANKEVHRLLVSWMRDNNSTNWAKGLLHVHSRKMTLITRH